MRLAIPNEGDDERAMPLPRYQHTQKLTCMQLRMTRAIPQGVEVRAKHPCRNIALGIQHILAVYSGRLYKVSSIYNALMVASKLDRLKDLSNRERLATLIQGNSKGGASKPSWLGEVVSKVLSHFSPYFLVRSHQTASWKRILRPGAMTGTYVVFFVLEPVEGEYLYDENRNNNGEYTQMAICDTQTRLLCPCNSHGSAFIMGRDLEALCDRNQRSTEVVDHLNTIPSRKGRGIYPLARRGNRKVSLGGIYELSYRDDPKQDRLDEDDN